MLGIMDQEEPLDCELCYGSCTCNECDEDGKDTNTGEQCTECDGTHECPDCGGSGTQ